MPRVADRNYTTLALPDSIIHRIDEFIADNSWGFRNRGEVAAAAIREFLQRYAELEREESGLQEDQ
jgi:metal-responsive CopG/Arc/MetJ family transcriptional regulator